MTYIFDSFHTNFAKSSCCLCCTSLKYIYGADFRGQLAFGRPRRKERCLTDEVEMGLIVKNDILINANNPEGDGLEIKLLVDEGVAEESSNGSLGWSWWHW